MSCAVLTVHHFIDKVLHLIQSARLNRGLNFGAWMHKRQL